MDLQPHQDDESLGCGGLIAACVARGTPPVAASLIDGALSHPGSRSHPPASLSRLRARGARVALRRLGVRRAVFLNAPDGAAPMAGEAFDALRATLIRLARGCSAVVTAWRGDPHCDHVAGARLAADVAASAGLKLVSYFDQLYAADPDPWRFATSAYERSKSLVTLAALPARRFSSGLEVGCSIGVLTRMLAAQCDRFLGLDVSAAPLAQARRTCADLRHVSFRQARIPDDWPAGRFDLIVLS